ncbi:MAG: porin family protein [Taibaiella sp.]|nr:porin family protein [Taibaiella sp.]
MGAPRHINKYILASIIAMVLLGGTTIAQSYDRSKLTKIDHKITVGFERRIYSVYMPQNITYSKKTQSSVDICNRILLRMKLTNHFRIETGLSYKAIDRILNNGVKQYTEFSLSDNNTISVPISLQYHVRNDKSRLRPYFGSGLQYTNHNTNITNGKDTQNNSQQTSGKLRYINFIFTQGLIYDITPDIQISQSIHILPENGIKPIGINFGIGYRIK